MQFRLCVADILGSLDQGCPGKLLGNCPALIYFGGCSTSHAACQPQTLPMPARVRALADAAIRRFFGIMVPRTAMRSVVNPYGAFS